VCILSEINSGTSIKQVRKYERATQEALNLSKSILKIIKMITYEKIVPVIPGNHIKDWQKIRKKQWKFVKFSLAKNLKIDGYEIKGFKDNYYLSEEVTGFHDPVGWEPTPILPMWLSPDQSREQWARIWDHLANGDSGCEWDFELYRKWFLDYAHTGERIPTKEQTYGAFGGMEQRLLDVFVRSETYTDDMFTLGKTEYRKIPWETPKRTHSAVIGKISTFFNDNSDVSNFSPSQWLHNLFISTFEYDIEYSESSDEYCMGEISNLLNEDLLDTFHENHIKAGLLLIDIFEDQMAPKYLRDLWHRVKKHKGYG